MEEELQKTVISTKTGLARVQPEGQMMQVEILLIADLRAQVMELLDHQPRDLDLVEEHPQAELELIQKMVLQIQILDQTLGPILRVALDRQRTAEVLTKEAVPKAIRIHAPEVIHQDPIAPTARLKANPPQVHQDLIRIAQPKVELEEELILIQILIKVQPDKTPDRMVQAPKAVILRQEQQEATRHRAANLAAGPPDLAAVLAPVERVVQVLEAVDQALAQEAVLAREVAQAPEVVPEAQKDRSNTIQSTL